MAEKYLKCPKCGTGNEENAKFCQACGWALGPAYAQIPVPVPTAKRSISTWVVVLVVVLVLLVAGIGAVYTQAWSKIKVIITHSEYSSIGVVILIDGISKALISVSPGESIVGVWSVVAGTHTVQIDRGYWYVQVITHLFSPDEHVNTYVAPDGTLENQTVKHYDENTVI